MRRLALAVLSLAAMAGCSRAQADAPSPPVQPPSPSAPPSAELVPAQVVAPPPSAAAPAATGFSSKTYRTVLQTGDSMVGGGLCRALQPRFAREGTKFVRDVLESGSIEHFAESDRVPMLLARHDPDLVLLTLGANDVGGTVTPFLGKKVEKIVAMTQKEGPRDCIWIGPPLWKGDKGLVDVLRAHAAPCRFYDSQHLVLSRAGDGIHPTEKGGEVWADAFWPFFKGEVDGGP